MIRRALVCGVSGQDGAYLAQSLAARGYDVHGTSRNTNSTPANLVRLGIVDAVTLHRMDAADPSDVADILTSVRPDEIYYLAAQSSVERSFKLPLETWIASAVGLVNVLEAARATVPEARILNAASGDCFGETLGSGPATEHTQFAPRSPYAAAKCAGHHAVNVARTAYGQFACSAFLFSHESPLRPDNFVVAKVASAVRQIASGSRERLRLANTAVIRDWGWAPEYVDAMRRMLQHDNPKDFVIATGHSHSLADFVKMAFAAANLDWCDHVDEGGEPPRPADVTMQYADPTRARELLGWKAEVGLSSLAHRLVRGEIG
jgi:GDPmannose 4,6-dehydratase